MLQLLIGIQRTVPTLPWLCSVEITVVELASECYYNENFHEMFFGDEPCDTWLNDDLNGSFLSRTSMQW